MAVAVAVGSEARPAAIGSIVPGPAVNGRAVVLAPAAGIPVRSWPVGPRTRRNTTVAASATAAVARLETSPL